MPTELESLPVEEIKVKMKSSEAKSAIGQEDFVIEFVRIMKNGDIWRTPKTLAKKLNVDEADLQNWMDKQPALVKRPGKEDGTFYFAILERLEKPKQPKGMERKAVTEEDRNYFSLLHFHYGSYLKILEKYALRIHEKNQEAFTALVQARDRMSVGVVLLANTLGSEVEKLPKL